jgi:hypothetical protein
MVELIDEGRAQLPQLSIAPMGQTLSVSRSAYYRWQAPGAATDPDMAVRDQIQRIALEDASVWLPTHHPRAAAGRHRGQP